MLERIVGDFSKLCPEATRLHSSHTRFQYLKIRLIHRAERSFLKTTAIVMTFLSISAI